MNNNVGIPYQDINWHDIKGQPFGIASRFNTIIFGDANNIIDTKGAMAVGGNFNSPRGLTLGYGNDAKLGGTGYSPDAVRFLVGGNVAMRRPLVVVGHVVAGGDFKAGSRSTYLIGKNNSPSQESELANLYQANGGSNYWKPSDQGDHYVISSYDVSRYIPAARIGANVSGFFQNARNSIMSFKTCIEALEANGTVSDNFHEWVLKGNDPRQNIFTIDVRPNGILDKGIRAEVPEGSLVIVRLRTGGNAHIQYGVWGEQRKAGNTLYVFEDANHIFMEKSSDIWGSILAPTAMFHAHSTGGHVSGNAALGSFAVDANSGFEFHLYPFVGGVNCEKAPLPIPEPIYTPKVPKETPSEELPEEVVPTPECPECPPAQPCPECPPAKPCPECPECPPAKPCPECPECPPERSCPECPECPPARPCPEYPPAKPCPECPEIPEAVITPGVIMGFLWGCSCCRPHKWEVRLYRYVNGNKVLIYCKILNSFDCFEFKVPYKGQYLLCVCPFRTGRRNVACKPIISFKNIGVSKLIIN